MYLIYCGVNYYLVYVFVPQYASFCVRSAVRETALPAQRVVLYYERKQLKRPLSGT